MKSSHAASGADPAAATPVTARAADELFVIQNPAAGMRSPDRLRRKIEAGLAERGVRFEHAYTREPGHGAELATQALAQGFRHVLVAGGDGTAREAVAALAGTEASLALLPVGTGNQLAANLGIPKGLSSIEVAVDGEERWIDLGLIDGRPFTSIAGAGIDSRIVSPKPAMKRRIGYLAYVQAATRAAFAPTCAEIRVQVDGREVSARGIGVEIVNMPGLTAPGLPRPVPIVPRGEVDDGELDGCLLAAETTLEVFSTLGAVLTRRFEASPRLRCFRGRRFRVEAEPALPVQADGEQQDATPFEVEVWPRALRVRVPHR